MDESASLPPWPPLGAHSTGGLSPITPSNTLDACQVNASHTSPGTKTHTERSEVASKGPLQGLFMYQISSLARILGRFLTQVCIWEPCSLLQEVLLGLPKGQCFQCPLPGSPRSTCCLRAKSPRTRNASAADWDRCVNRSQGSGGGGGKARDDPARGQTIGKGGAA